MIGFCLNNSVFERVSPLIKFDGSKVNNRKKWFEESGLQRFFLKRKAYVCIWMDNQLKIRFSCCLHLFVESSLPFLSSTILWFDEKGTEIQSTWIFSITKFRLISTQFEMRWRRLSYLSSSRTDNQTPTQKSKITIFARTFKASHSAKQWFKKQAWENSYELSFEHKLNYTDNIKYCSKITNFNNNNFDKIFLYYLTGCFLSFTHEAYVKIVSVYLRISMAWSSMSSHCLSFATNVK